MDLEIGGVQGVRLLNENIKWETIDWPSPWWVDPPLAKVLSRWATSLLWSDLTITSHHITGKAQHGATWHKTHWLFDLTMCCLPSHIKQDLWRWMWWRIWHSYLDFRRWAPGLFLWPFFFKPLQFQKVSLKSPMQFAACFLLSSCVFFSTCSHHLFYNRKPKTFTSFLSLLLYFLDVHVSLTVWPAEVLQSKQSNLSEKFRHVDFECQ